MFEKRQQISICIIGALLAADFVLFGYMPSYTRLKELRAAESRQSRVIAQAQVQKRRLSVLKEGLAELEVQVANYDSSVPARREIGQFLHGVASMMNGQDLKEQRIEPGEQITTERLNCIPVDIRCRGSLAQVFEFCRKLQSLDRLVRIQQVKLVNDRNFTGEVSMQTKVIIYYKSGRQG